MTARMLGGMAIRGADGSMPASSRPSATSSCRISPTNSGFPSVFAMQRGGEIGRGLDPVTGLDEAGDVVLGEAPEQ